MHGNFVAGEWVQTGASRANLNPSDLDDVIGEYASADAALVEQAIAAAHAAFPAWSRSTPEVRADCLEHVAAELLARSDELGRLLAREEGKTLPEAIGEVIRAGRVFRFFAGEALRLTGDRMASTRQGVDVETTREPEGVIGIITPWNFPIAIPAWKIAPALAFGNCVVFKPAELVPGSAWALAEILSRAGLPQGVFNLVSGPGSVVGAAMARSRHVNAVSFTGSTEVGRRLAGELVGRGAKVQLEMGGKNPLIILDDADLGIAIDCAVNGAYFSTGQRCTASSRLIVQESVHDRFVAELVERLERLKVDNALSAGCEMGPVASAAQLAQNQDYIGVGLAEGAKLACSGALLERATRGHYMAPALFIESTNAMRINQEEMFGPVACVIRVRDYEEAAAVANDTEFGLSSGICTTSLKYAANFKRRSTAGMVMVNLPTAGVDYHAPFGGRRGSSYGPREQGSYAREFYTAVKVAYTRP